MVPFSQNEVAGLQSQARISRLSSEDLQHKLTQAFGEKEDLARRLKLAEDALGEKVLGVCGPLACTVTSPDTEMSHPRERHMTRRGQHVSRSRIRSSNYRGSWKNSRGREGVPRNPRTRSVGTEEPCLRIVEEFVPTPLSSPTSSLTTFPSPPPPHLLSPLLPSSLTFPLPLP